MPADSVRRPAGQLTDPAYVKRQRLQAEANQVEQHLLQQPENRMRLTDLERTFRTSMPMVARGLQRARTRLRPFVRMFPRMFKLERGVIVAVNAPATATQRGDKGGAQRTARRIAGSQQGEGGARAGHEG